MKETPKVPAFKRELEVSAFRGADEGKLLRFKNDPRFVVREITRADFADDLVSEDTVPDITELAQKTKTLFSELQKMGVNIPVHFVVAKNENTGKNNLYILTDVIARADPFSTSTETKRFKRELRKTMKALVAYYERACRLDDEFLTDVFPGSELFEHGHWAAEKGQYVYGKREGDKTNQLFLVDVDPYFSNDRNELLLNINFTIDDLKDMQKLLNVRFSKEISLLSQLARDLTEELGIRE